MCATAWFKNYTWARICEGTFAIEETATALGLFINYIIQLGREGVEISVIKGGRGSEIPPKLCFIICKLALNIIVSSIHRVLLYFK